MFRDAEQLMHRTKDTDITSTSKRCVSTEPKTAVIILNYTSPNCGGIRQLFIDRL